jgi:hypothetical protein
MYIPHDSHPKVSDVVDMLFPIPELKPTKGKFQSLQAREVNNSKQTATEG